MTCIYVVTEARGGLDTAVSVRAMSTAAGADLLFRPVHELAARVRSGELTARELVQASLDRIEALNPTINAFVDVFAEDALAEADAIRPGDPRPYAGVPIAIKNNRAVAGRRLTFAANLIGDFVAPYDHNVVVRLKAAGFIVVGTTTLPEWGILPTTETARFGATRNPWDQSRTPGGSSGGSAAAVAAGMVPIAHANDGGGSTRIPAACCGLVGLKPQRGRISTWPDRESFHGLACFGPLARSAGDAALLLDAVHGAVPADAHQPGPPAEPYADAAERGPGQLRIALSLRVPFGIHDRLCIEHREATLDLARRLEALGHDVDVADLDYGLVAPALVPRGMAGVRDWLRDHEIDSASLEPRTRVHARLGGFLSGPALRAARAAEPRLRRRLGRIFDSYDLVLTPTTAKPPPRIGALDRRGYWVTGSAASETCPYAFPWNVTGWPAISVPAGRTPEGLPIGAQLLAHEGQEGLLLAVAAQLETAAA
jgi:amidase